MQFTSNPKHTATRGLIATLAVLAMWFLGPVLAPFVVAAALLAGVPRARASKLYQGETPSWQP
ncbi:MAG: hypothetical protein MUP33_08385 [Polaromonas sp.]|nr:hypothetical protein [Polaromonas sp.]